MADKPTFKAPVPQPRSHEQQYSWADRAMAAVHRRMDPKAFKAQQMEAWLNAKAQEQALQPDYGLMTAPKDISAGVGQYLVGEALSAAGVDPVGLLMQGADAVGANPAYGLALGAGLLGAGKLRKAGKAAAQELREARKLKGALAPEVDPTPGKVSQELTRAQRRELPPETLDRMSDIKAKHPELGRALPYMTPLEVSKVISSPETIAKMDRLLSILPQAEKMAAVMKMGEPKRGWYRASTQALIDIFGYDDAPRFASLLAATSPQTSVEGNLRNALSIWTNWERAGRPTDPKAIRHIMGKSVQGSGTEASVLEAWAGNTVRALSAENPMKVTLSGPKVNNFARNLQDDVYKVTNDAWMANGMGVTQSLFSGSPTPLQLASGDPGMSAGYSAVSARVRQGANKLGYTPSEGQEAYWSTVMPLYEGAKAQGMDPRDFLQKGLLTPEVIRGTPDFSTLLKQGEYGDILRRGGYGDRLDQMASHEWPKIHPSLSSREQQYVMDTAGTLAELGGSRRRETRALTVPVGYKPDSAFLYSTHEFIPGEKSGVGSAVGVSPAILSAPESSRRHYTQRVKAAFVDPQGHDVINRSLFPGRTIETRPMQGMFTAPSGNVETQAGYAAGVELPLRRSRKGEPFLHPEDEAALRAGEGIRGLLTQQHGSPASGITPYEAGNSYFVPREGKAGVPSLLAGQRVDPDMAFADVGKGINAISFSPGPMSTGKKDLLQEALQDEAKLQGYRGKSLGVYVDRSKGLLELPQGTGEMTREWLKDVDSLPARRQKGLSQGLRQVADPLHSVYSKLGPEDAPRTDVMNLIQMLKTNGIPAVREGLKRGAILPTAAALGYFTNLYGTGEEQPGGR